jgi:hypothetical protein
MDEFVFEQKNQFLVFFTAIVNQQWKTENHIKEHFQPGAS